MKHILALIAVVVFSVEPAISAAEPPKADADITKVLFAQFKWVVSGETSTKKN